jgi:hypothetical protein
MKKILFVLSLFLLSACSSSDSDSGGMVEATLPGTDIPASFAGTYVGTLNVTASALGLSESDSFPITITVTNDGMVRFDGDDPDETFTVGLTNEGAFSGNLPINEDECTGSVGTEGMVDGTNASGTISGDGTCVIDGLTVDVTLEGDFTASK